MPGIIILGESVLRSFSFVGSAVGTGTTIDLTSLSSGAIAFGDLCLIYNFGLAPGDVTPTNVTPSGFTSLATVADNLTSRARISAKKLLGTETTVSGIDGNTTELWAVAVFRPNALFSAFANGMTPNAFANSTDPPVQTITANGATPPVILYGQMGASSAISPRTISPAMDEIAGATTAFYAHFKIYNAGSTPANHTYDMDNEGSYNSLMCGYLTFS